MCISCDFTNRICGSCTPWYWYNVFKIGSMWQQVFTMRNISADVMSNEELCKAHSIMLYNT